MAVNRLMRVEDFAASFAALAVAYFATLLNIGTKGEGRERKV
jgi:hypothetical protein